MKNKTLEKFSKKIFKLLIELVVIAANGLITLVTAILMIIHPDFHYSNVIFICSISILLAQTIIVAKQNADVTMSIKSSNFVMPILYETISGDLCRYINGSDEISLKIICYGTSGYENVEEKIDYANRNNGNVKANILFYNPSKKQHFCEKDKTIIQEQINRARKVKGIVVHESEILPSIRGCVVYNTENKPIWCCFQTYCYHAKLGTASYYHTPALVTNNNNDEIGLLSKLEKIISDEYKRLGGKWKDVDIVDDDKPKNNISDVKK